MRTEQRSTATAKLDPAGTNVHIKTRTPLRWAARINLMRQRAKALRRVEQARPPARAADRQPCEDGGPITCYVNTGSRLCGNLHCTHWAAHIDGEVSGSIIAASASRVALGASALVNGRIIAQYVVVSGCVRGDIIASSHVLVRAGALIIGDIYCRRVAVEAGGILRGRLWQHGELPPECLPVVLHLPESSARAIASNETSALGGAFAATLAGVPSASTTVLRPITTAPQYSELPMIDASSWHTAAARRFLRKV